MSPHKTRTVSVYQNGFKGFVDKSNYLIIIGILCPFVAKSITSRTFNDILDKLLVILVTSRSSIKPNQVIQLMVEDIMSRI
jgi:hypothetical protein